MRPEVGGANEIRTRDLLLAKQALYQLSYDPEGLNQRFTVLQRTYSFLKTELCDAIERPYSAFADGIRPRISVISAEAR